MLATPCDDAPPLIPYSLDLAERLESQIALRAWGQIRDLQVLCLGDQIIIRGRSRTYHAKQMAQEAALDLTGGRAPLANEIIVC